MKKVKQNHLQINYNCVVNIPNKNPTILPIPLSLPLYNLLASGINSP